jgi:hypothetical protein
MPDGHDSQLRVNTGSADRPATFRKNLITQLHIDPCPALRRKRIGQVLFAHHPQSAQRPRVREDKIEQPTRGAFDRSSIRFNRLIELDLATRRFTGFDVIYHT